MFRTIEPAILYFGTPVVLVVVSGRPLGIPAEAARAAPGQADQ